MPSPTVICLYRVARGRETAFSELLRRHWPTLHGLGLVTDQKPVHYQGHEQDGSPIFVEIFAWKTEKASSSAHEHPEVMAIWEPMDKLCESRSGRPNMEFPHVHPIPVA